jgi:hypothetical protein
MSQHIVSLYDNHEQAVEAVKLLKIAGFNEKHISLLGKTDVGDDVQIKDAKIAAKGVGIGALVGVLAGIGLTAIPGVGIFLRHRRHSCCCSWVRLWRDRRNHCFCSGHKKYG